MHIQTNKRQSTKGDQIRPVIVYCLQIAEKVAYSQVKGEHVHDVWLVGARGQNVVFRATGSLYSLLNEPGKYRNDKGIIAQQVKQVKFPLHCLYCSIYFYRTTRDHKKTSPVEKNKIFKTWCTFSGSRISKIWRQKTFMEQSLVTSEGSHESIDGAVHTAQSKISHHARVKCDWESKADNDEPRHSQVHQHEPLVLNYNQECQEVDREASTDEEKQVQAQHSLKTMESAK